MENEKKPNYPHWDVEDSHPGMIDKLRDAFRQVRDPEIGMDIIQLGLIRNVAINENKANIDMILTTPYCPYAPMLMESARKKAEEVFGIPTDIKYAKEVWNQTMMEDDTALNWGLF